MRENDRWSKFTGHNRRTGEAEYEDITEDSDVLDLHRVSVLGSFYSCQKYEIRRFQVASIDASRDASKRLPRRVREAAQTLPRGFQDASNLALYFKFPGAS